MSTQVTYKGNTIANFTNDTKTLKTAGKYMEDDVTITEVIAGQGNVWQDEDGYVHLDDESGLDFQAKSVNPTESSQTVRPDAGYTALSQVTVGAISSTYVGTGIARKSSTDLTASGSTVTAPAGYYSAQATKNISGGQAFTPAVTITTNPTFSLVSSTGKLTAAYTGSSNVTPTVTAGYIAAGTSGRVTTTGTSTYMLTTQAATTYNVSTADQTIASYRWLTGAQTIKSVTTENIFASNIKSGVTVKVGDANNASRITQVTGTLVEGVDAPTFTVIWDDNWSAPISATCDKTYAECKNYYDSGIAFSGNVINTDQSHSSQYVGAAVCLGVRSGATDELIKYSVYTGSVPYYDLLMYTDGTITITYPSAYVTPLNITQNGTIRNYDYFYDPINVNVSNKYTATLTSNGDSTWAYVSYQNIYYYTSGDSFSFTPGDSLRCRMGYGGHGNYIYLNGVQVAGNTTAGVYYDLTLPDADITIKFVMDLNRSELYIETSAIPEGTLSITSNGTYNVREYANANVNVAGFTIDNIAKRTISGAISGSATYIGYYAFAECQQISQANFSLCTNISNSAFYRCLSLSQISFPVCTTIGNFAFAGCRSLTQANFPSCTSIGANAFTSCRSLTQVSFPVCTTIGAAAFDSCFYLTQVSFPSCTSIGTTAFSGCTALSQANFPACLSIGSGAFSGCLYLSQASFPVCSSIGSSAFYACKQLHTVIISNSQEISGTIGNGAFSNCWRLLSLYLLSSAYIHRLLSPFSSTFRDTPIYNYTEYTGGVFGNIFVPSSIYSTYIKATYWSTYSSRFVSLTDAQINNVLIYGRHDP